MAISSLNSMYFEPAYPNDASTTPGFSTTQISILNSSYEIAYVLQAPKTGTINGIMFRTATVTTGSTIEIRLETVSGGLPTGTLLSTNTNITQAIADTDDNVVFNVTFTGSASVTKGDVFCIRFKNSSGTPNTIGLAQFIDAGLLSTPTVIRSTNSGSTWAHLGGYGSICALAYSDGSYPNIPGFFPFTDLGTANFTSSTTPDTFGNLFTLNVKSRIVGYWTYIDMDGAYTMKVYDSSGVVTNSSITPEPTYPYATIGNVGYYILPTPIELEASTNYVLAIEATDTTSNTYYYADAPSTALMEAMPGGGHFTAVSAKDPADTSDFTETDTRMIFIGLLIDGIETGGGSSEYSFTSM